MGANPPIPPVLVTRAINTTAPLSGGGDLSADRTIALLGPLASLTSFTAHGVLIGEGTSPIGATSPGNAGEILTSNGSNADPSFQAAPSGGVTLNGAYDFGGAGVGRAISAVSGAVRFFNFGTNNADSILEISKITGAPEAGSGIDIQMGNFTTGAAISISQLGTGYGVNLATQGTVAGIALAQTGSGAGLTVSMGAATVSAGISVTMTAGATGAAISIPTGGGMTFGTATAVANALVFGTGGGAITQIQGPTDEDFTISASSEGTGAGGSSLNIFAGPGGATVGYGGLLTMRGGDGFGTGAAGGGTTFIGGGNGSTSAANQDAGSLIALGGTPSGTGIGHIVARVGYTGASGSAAQTIGDRLFISSHTVTLSTTSNTITSLFQLDIPTSNSSGGACVFYCLEVNDGTNWDTVTGFFTVSASNKAGTVTAAIGTVTGQSTNPNSGTFTANLATQSITGTRVNVGVRPTWTVITPTSAKGYWTAMPFGKGVTVSAN